MHYIIIIMILAAVSAEKRRTAYFWAVPVLFLLKNIIKNIIMQKIYAFAALLK